MTRPRGRPRRLEVFGPRSPYALWRRGERLKQAYPRVPLRVICRTYLGVDASTFRRWRTEFATPYVEAHRAILASAFLQLEEDSWND